MLWTTIEQVQAQLRLDDAQLKMERVLLESYAEAAEETVLTTIRRSLLGVLSTYGGIPRRLRLATLMLVDLWYKVRCPVEQISMSAVPYTFDLLIKSYMRLSIDEDDDQESLSILMDYEGWPLKDADGLLLCADVA